MCVCVFVEQKFGLRKAKHPENWPKLYMICIHRFDLDTLMILQEITEEPLVPSNVSKALVVSVCYLHVQHHNLLFFVVFILLSVFV